MMYVLIAYLWIVGPGHGGVAMDTVAAFSGPDALAECQRAAATFTGDVDSNLRRGAECVPIENGVLAGRAGPALDGAPLRGPEGVDVVPSPVLSPRPEDAPLKPPVVRKPRLLAPKPRPVEPAPAKPPEAKAPEVKAPEAAPPKPAFVRKPRLLAPKPKSVEPAPAPTPEPPAEVKPAEVAPPAVTPSAEEAPAPKVKKPKKVRPPLPASDDDQASPAARPTGSGRPPIP